MSYDAHIVMEQHTQIASIMPRWNQSAERKQSFVLYELQYIKNQRSAELAAIIFFIYN